MVLTLFAWSLLTALLVMLLAPGSQLETAVRESLVEAPARFLLDMTWAKVGRIVLLAPVFVVLMVAGPEVVAMMVLMGGDLAAVELLLALSAASLSGSLGAMWRSFAGGVTRLSQSVRNLSDRAFVRRAPRSYRRTGIKRPRNDDIWNISVVGSWGSR